MSVLITEASLIGLRRGRRAAHHCPSHGVDHGQSNGREHAEEPRDHEDESTDNGLTLSHTDVLTTISHYPTKEYPIEITLCRLSEFL